MVFVLVLSLLRALIEPLRESSFGIGVAHQTALDVACAALALGALLSRAQRRAGAGTSVS